ncbi:glycosyltransferase family 87 protein [Dyella mobilis]|uniref:DUF2029 domain-containing protein n=1 Tax=Dyella mobilis TaxID=1849582 RepID=A0ABS2KMG0_9GAMM|nr:glycosyltransferase 87 family protein [Dyella mobilis]MBM7132345.1 DUF2029 domain-containing protein [Dyella mobilis]
MLVSEATVWGFEGAMMKMRLNLAFYFLAIACFISLCLGQDNNFDLQNYHLYNAWAITSGRWHRDFIVSGLHTFFSPVLDTPYFALSNYLLPNYGALLVALAGIPYAALLYVVYLISARFADRLGFYEKWDRTGFLGASVLLAGTGAATWSQIGTTTNDITVAAIVLLGFYQVIRGGKNRESDSPDLTRLVIAGALLGLAVGLKLTAAIYALPLAAMIFVLMPNLRDGVRGVVVCGCGALLAFVVAYGPWAWMLYKLTGNPFFPMFNGVFHSDWLTNVPMRDTRFLPRSPMQWLFYPFYWVTLQESLVTELPFRDARYALGYVLVVFYALKAIFDRIRPVVGGSAKSRLVGASILFVFLSYVLWECEFSILRYLVAVECLIGTFIAAAAMTVAKKLDRVKVWLPAACTLGVAILIVCACVSPDWGRIPTGTDFLAVRAPSIENGSLVIFADEPMSYLALGLKRDNRSLRFVTIPRDFEKGGVLGADPLQYGLGRGVRAELNKNHGGLYVLFYTSHLPPGPSLAAFNVQLDAQSCKPGESALGPDFFVCQASYGAAPISSTGQSSSYRLHANVSELRPGVSVHFDWLSDDCVAHATTGQATIRWNVAGSSDAMRLYIGSSLEESKLMLEGAPAGEIQTGPWINGGMHLDLVDAKSSDKMAHADVTYEKCDN